jgi:hypothetical protein
MKKAGLSLACCLLTTAAFGQGKVIFENDSSHLVYWNPNPALSAGFAPGEPVGVGGGPSGLNLAVDLYMGTATATLSLVATTSLSLTPVNPGQWTPATVALPGFPSGTTLFTQVQVHDAAYATATQAELAGGVFGFSQEFTVTLGGLTGTPITSTWPIGTYPLPPYGFGAIMIGIIPEPSALCIAVIAAAAFVWKSNRRKQR